MSTKSFVPTVRPYIDSFVIDLVLLAVVVGVIGLLVWGVAGRGYYYWWGLALFVIVVARSLMAWYEVLRAKRFAGWQKPVRAVFGAQAMAIEGDEGTLFWAPYSDLKRSRRYGSGFLVVFPDGSRVAIPSDSFASVHDFELVDHHIRGILRELNMAGGPH